MSRAVANRLVDLLKASPGIKVLDITGGAPEMHQEFVHLVKSARQFGIQVIDRCNLTVLSLPGMESLPEFLASNKVKVVASLPCYTKETVDKQRGDDVFEASIHGLRLLNQVGYAQPDSDLELDLVYNPSGAFLPPPQEVLEKQYHDELQTLFGIQFNALLCISNMPIKRFRQDLKKQGKLTEYQQLLENAFNPSTLDNLMCVSQVHIDHNGSLFDCDFNYALNMPIGPSIFNIESFQQLNALQIKTADHCFGCTAGAGSSCGGSLV
eukprot:CAMPEP_0182449784 /NCGR_PEP_ID=MMETSP1172-20130603/36653_1 /TAXON_ID=708627 /ORGANISM="Timspurckia oligopyrenoides, Strain CCMP3278" /LENGTH=266 /DNA_ID=CAMNT_0024647159 /DNA_START=333 /DNA_END=1133 /DNA_ORIENTATION=-